MESLKNRLLEDMKTAMKEKDKKKLSVIRMARAAIKNEEINKRKELNDEEVVEVLAREVKQHRQSISEYKKSGRTDIVEDLENEIKILSDYLPEQLTIEEIEKLVEEVIAKTDAEDLSDMGKVMGQIMPEVTGRADGSVISKVVREKLTDN